MSSNFDSVAGTIAAVKCALHIGGADDFDNFVGWIDEVFEPPRGKTNNVVSEQVRHKPACTATEAG